jgi:CheY-like chemotaxis protein
MVMPGMDGIELGRLIRADSTLDNTLMVMMTSLGQRGDGALLREIGFSGYLTKPIRQAQLKECLQLVLGRGEATARTSADNLVTRHTVSEMYRKKIRILLAEDNPTNQLVALTVLRKLGYRADAVANGVEVLNALQDVPYDIVLMDCQMPEMDGYEASRRIRSRDRRVPNPRIPIIAMTANALKGDREKCLAAGMDDYIAKPVQTDELSKTIEPWIKKILPGGQFPGTGCNKAIIPGHSHQEIQKIFDERILLDILMDDRKMIRGILENFLEDMPGQIQELQIAVENGRFPEIQATAHSIKGVAANIGSNRFMRVAKEIEKAAKAEDLERIRDIFPSILEQFDLLKMTLENSEWVQP